ncbi:MAG: ribH [Verrucomicrobiales bacterium]|nr:ribH [Verrucomicrobiales bacterium]
MLRKNSKTKAKVAGRRFAIVASKYNAEYVDSMLNAARAEIERAGGTVQVVRVPGAFEVPVIAAHLAAKDSKLRGIICLGVILRGETDHAQQIGNAVTSALMEIQLQYGIPVIHEVLLLENRAQAKVRCLSKDHNRGMEAAQTALQMARVIQSL